MANIRINDELLQQLNTIKAFTKAKSIDMSLKPLVHDVYIELSKRYKEIKYEKMSLKMDNMEGQEELESRKMFSAVLTDSTTKVFGYEDHVIKFDGKLYVDTKQYNDEVGESECTVSVFIYDDIKRSDLKFLLENELHLEDA